MIYWTLKWIVVSLILIFLIHYLYLFFKTNLTVPKVKDLVNTPTEKYNEILNTIKALPEPTMETPNKEDMQSELKNFLSDLKKPEEVNTTPTYYSNETENVFSTY